jgi:hypothetical protein
MSAVGVYHLLHNLTALLAFSGVSNMDCTTFPCRIQPLYSLNFAGLPILGTIVNLYPAGNLFAVVVKSISLRNNLMHYMVPSKVHGDSSAFDPFVIMFTLLALVPCYLISATITDV